MSIRRRYKSVSHSRNESYSQNHTAQTHQRCADCKTFVTGLADQTIVTSCAGGRHSIPPPPVTLTFDLLTLKVVSESRVTWVTNVPILVFLGLSVLGLGPMFATDRRQTDRRQTSESIIV